MKTKKIWANFAVSDVEKTRDFYQKLGFKSNAPNDSKELASILVGEDGFIIHFFEKERFKNALEGEISNLKEGNEIIFSLSADSRKEVDEWVEVVKKAGGKIHFDPRKDKKELYDQNGFYVCVFSDPDGHKFNVLFCQ